MFSTIRYFWERFTASPNNQRLEQAACPSRRLPAGATPALPVQSLLFARTRFPLAHGTGQAYTQ